MTRVPLSTEGLEEAAAKDPHQVINFWRALANNAPIHAGMTRLIEAVWDHTGLTAREREIVVLSVASELQSRYIWYQHTSLVADEDLLAHHEVEAIQRDDRSEFAVHEAVLVAYARAVARARVVDDVHDTLAQHYPTETVVGIAALAATYVAAALLMSALAIDLDQRPIGRTA